MAADTLYNILGVPQDATGEEIRSAYRRLSKTYHPDLGGTAAFFRQLQRAHQILTDPSKRAEYDRSLRASATAPPPRQDNKSEPQGQGQNPSQRSGSSSSQGRSRPGSPSGGRENPSYSASGRLHNSTPGYQRFLASWSRGINAFAATTGRRGQRRQEAVAAAWVTSVIVALVVVATLLEATHGLALLLLLVLGIFGWRRHVATKQVAQRDRETREAAERQHGARASAAERDRAATARQRAEQAASAERERKARDAREAKEAEEKQRMAQTAAQSGDLEAILGLSPTQFEYTMAALLRMLGMTDVQRVGGRGDLGVDITARDPAGRTMVVQCKRYARSKKIGSPDIQQFIGMAHVHHQADLKLFVTTSDFTNDARELAQRHDIQLMNGTAIESLARKHKETNR
jgi:curved DNA-binding protein CbpA